MVELPGSLERSTLGDVLGALHRERVTGTLLLHELSSGREHRHVIVWRDGLIHHVETTRRRAPGVGGPGHSAAADWTRSGAASSELLERLELLFELERARLSFRVMGPRPPQTPAPLGPNQFLHGRRRSRDAAGTARPRPPEAEAPPRPRAEGPRRPPADTLRVQALRLLGLEGEPRADDVRAAFRRMARQWHPDRHPDVSEPIRAALGRRFAQISGAYEHLIGHAR
jgi:DnaJ-like protein